MKNSKLVALVFTLISFLAVTVWADGKPPSSKCNLQIGCTGCHMPNGTVLECPPVKKSAKKTVVKKTTKKSKKTTVIVRANPPSVVDPRLVQLQNEINTLKVMISQSSSSTSTTVNTVDPRVAQLEQQLNELRMSRVMATYVAPVSAPDGKLVYSDGTTWLIHDSLVKSGKSGFNPNSQYLAMGEKKGLLGNQWFQYESDAASREIFKLQPPVAGSQYWRWSAASYIPGAGLVRFNVVQLNQVGQVEGWSQIHLFAYQLQANYTVENGMWKNHNGLLLKVS